jgi:hypothetical protein
MLLSKHIERERTAPELYGTFWFNGEPITLRSRQGNVVILFFWDHTSTNSLRAVKHLNRLHAMYGECGLTVIGVQVSEYITIHDPAKKEAIIRSSGITFPVVCDDERHIADSYRIETFPTVCLIAGKGDIYDVQPAIGSLFRLERSIQYLLRQTGYFGELPFVEYTEGQPADYAIAGLTPDFDLGYLHGSLGNSEGYNPELPAEYQDPFLYVEGKFYAQGIWIAGKNSFEYAGEGNDGYILFPYAGHDVDIVVGNEAETDPIRVLIDGKSIEVEIWGGDIAVDASGSTVVKINALTSTHLVRSRAVRNQTVKLIPSKKGTTFYRVSFAPFEGPSEAIDENDPTPFHSN